MNAQFPMKYLNVTQGYGVGTHKGTYALDLAGKDKGIDNVYAPFDCKVKKIWHNGSTVWVESVNKVRWANGTVAKVTASFTHDNNVSNLRVGQIIKQGTVFYQEGTAGQATGNHVHLETAKGSFVGTGWLLNKYGWWTIRNKVKPNLVLFLKKSTVVKNTGGLLWKREPLVSKPTPVAYTALTAVKVRKAPSTSAKTSGSRLKLKGMTFTAVKTVHGGGYVRNGKRYDTWLQSRYGNFSAKEFYKKK